MDSRLRGNDENEAGNDENEAGNDENEAGNDENEAGNDENEAGNDENEADNDENEVGNDGSQRVPTPERVLRHPAERGNELNQSNLFDPNNNSLIQYFFDFQKPGFHFIVIQPGFVA